MMVRLLIFSLRLVIELYQPLTPFLNTRRNGQSLGDAYSQGYKVDINEPGRAPDNNGKRDNKTKSLLLDLDSTLGTCTTLLGLAQWLFLPYRL